MTVGSAGGPPRRRPLRSFLRGCGRLFISRHLHGFVHLAWMTLKTAAVVLFLLWTLGIPGVLLSPYLQSYVTPYQVTVSRITLHPAKGIVVRGIELVDSTIATSPVARITTCVVRPSYRRLLRGEFDVRSVRWSGGRIALHQKDTLAERPEGDTLVDHVNGELIHRDHEAVLRIDAVSDIGARYRIDGRIGFGAPGATPPGEGPGWSIALRNIHHALFESPAWLTFVRDRFGEMDFAEPPRLDIAFDHDPRRAEPLTASLAYRAPAFVYYGQPFDGIGIDLVRSNGLIEITRAEVRQGAQRLLLTGSYAPSNELFTAHLYSDLPASAAVPFLPLGWREKAERWGLAIDGAMQTEAWIGPCPIAEVPRSWGGWAIVADGRLNEFPIERAFASFKRQQDRLTIEDAQLAGGRGIGRGELGFSLVADQARRTLEGTCDLSFELRQLDAILPRGLRRVARFFEIETRPVAFTGSFTTPLDDPDRTVVTGLINGTNGAFRGASLTGFNTGLVYSNNHVRLDPFHVTCATGAVRGSLDLDLKRELYRVDLEITTDPRSVALMGGTNLARYFKPYHFTDDIRAVATGLIDARHDRETDLAVQLGGRGIGYGPFTFDRIAAQARRIPGSLLISNITGAIYNGAVTGRVEVSLADTGDRFRAGVAATNVSLDLLAAALTRQPTNQYEGIIAAHVDLAGDVPEPAGWPGLTGDGTVVIEQGRLLRIPVFGGLSTLLEKIYPGLGFSEQNRLEATLRFAEGAVITDDLRLSGNLVSLSADGRYRWSDDLDFDIKVHPFRDGSVASVLRIVTLPLSFILELELTGPLRNPRWRAANLPL